MTTMNQPRGVTLLGALVLALAGYAAAFGVLNRARPDLTAQGLALVASMGTVGFFLLRGKNWARRLCLWGAPALYAVVVAIGMTRRPDLVLRMLWQPNSLILLIVFVGCVYYLNTGVVRSYFSRDRRAA